MPEIFKPSDFVICQGRPADREHGALPGAVGRVGRLRDGVRGRAEGLPAGRRRGVGRPARGSLPVPALGLPAQGQGAASSRRRPRARDQQGRPLLLPARRTSSTRSRRSRTSSSTRPARPSRRWTRSRPTSPRPALECDRCGRGSRTRLTACALLAVNALPLRARDEPTVAASRLRACARRSSAPGSSPGGSGTPRRCGPGSSP